jgi:hypothetical protein
LGFPTTKVVGYYRLSLRDMSDFVLKGTEGLSPAFPLGQISRTKSDKSLDRQKYLLSFRGYPRLIKWGVSAPLNDMATSPKRWLIEKMVGFIARITPPCHDITRLLSQSMDRRLPLRTRLAIRLHFEICVWCKRYGQQLAAIRKASRSVPERAKKISQVSLPEQARKRIKEAVSVHSNQKATESN